MISVTGILLICGFTFLVYKLFFSDFGKNFPKGPFALPLFGNGLQLQGNLSQQLVDWHKKYGDIYRIYIGSDRCFVINDLQLAKQLFNENKFSARHDNILFQVFSGGSKGILNASGQIWSDQRRFTIRHLRDFGFGKSDGEQMIVAEVKEMLDSLAKDTGKSILINKTQQMAVLNTLWQIEAGIRYEHDDPRLWSIFKQNLKLLEILGKNPFILFAPKLAQSYPRLLGWSRVNKVAEEMRSIVDGHIDTHKNTFSNDGPPRDFIDCYLKAIDSTVDPQSSFYKEDGYDNLAATLGDLFFAGFETVVTTVSWFILYLVKYPELQKKVQEEMDRVVGRNRLPALADRPLLPYTEAAIHESMRIKTTIPLGLFHMATEDTKIREYDVPKGSLVICPLAAFHNDEKYFPNPGQFQPERFLTPDGKFQKHEAVVPFGIGKRACLGETLARDEVFLFVTHLFHRFSIRPSDENPEIDEEPNPGIASSPRDYKCVLTERM